MPAKALSARYRPTSWRGAIAVVCLLAGCASPPATLPPEKLTGALLVIRLESRFDAPAFVDVEVALPGQGKTSNFAGPLQRNLPGQYADYLITLPLAPERYLLSSLRENPASATATGAAAEALRLNISFDVRDKNVPDYIGRVVIASRPAAGPPTVSIDDQYDEDSLLFRTSVAKLKKSDIGRNVNGAMLPAQAPPAPPPTPPAPPAADSSIESAGAPRLELAAVTAEASRSLPLPSRASFARFLKLKSPRAFAIGPAGEAGVGSGPGAIATAMRQCVQKSKGIACRLFAVDETVVADNSCLPHSGNVPSDPLAKADCKGVPKALP